MALPPQRTFTAKFTHPVTGEAQVGFALFDIIPNRWTDKDGNQILLGTRQRSFDEGSEGEISIPLVITDESDDILPVENRFWQMRVCIDSEWEQYIFTIPAGSGSIDLTDVEVIQDPDTGQTYVPVPGPPGTDGAPGADGVVQSVNGQSTADIVLTAEDLGAVPATGGTFTGSVVVDDDLAVSGAFTVDGRAPLFNSISVDTYLDGDMNGEFSSAHRGSGMLYPEHTLEAYRASLAEGAPAIEVSAQLTKDGVLVCFHDTDVSRMTDLTGAIADYTYSQLLNAVKVKAQTLLGSGWQDCDIPTVAQVLDELLGKCIIFL